MACTTEAWMHGALFGAVGLLIVLFVADSIRWSRRQSRMEARVRSLEIATQEAARDG